MNTVIALTVVIVIVGVTLYLLPSHYPSGGELPKRKPGDDEVMVILSQGYEPVETPSEPPAPLTWEDHTRNCRICQERNL
ncbi:hypothetical protein [Streptomyces hydrogenans]|uniref:Secreted protein n=1 Tax=Streptomyces hydrogenans TaxID=1873719 RepID=A0ABQ3PJE6_9ACTN|nr:hypothetical protein [Streptomyces hydrogenans]GHF94507.1 hypothetical protein GCM10018784_02720 [Streptomyces hydrogenans]GHI25146.1 hypothetical protein Shyd_65170 [Streptomyces hydrogenans]